LSLWPYSLIQPICFAGLPTHKEYAGTFLVTTAPAPINANAPISWPHTMVALAPIGLSVLLGEKTYNYTIEDSNGIQRNVKASDTDKLDKIISEGFDDEDDD
jgi:hypothetical protein